jgi:ferritin-like metal-binding protein YciE
MKKLKTLRDLLVHELRDIYSAETQLVKALPDMMDAASHEQLRACFEEHLEQTEAQVERLDEIFEILGDSPKGEPCKGMKGLVQEGDKMIDEDAEDAVRDAGLIAAAQRIEHYEIAAYGTARTFASILGEEEIVSLLSETLEEEKETDQELSDLAESVINVEAVDSSEG